MPTVADLKHAIENKKIYIVINGGTEHSYIPNKTSINHIEDHLKHLQQDPIIHLYTYFNYPKYKPYKQAYISMLEEVLFRKRLGLPL